ncbi:1,3-beta-glucanosyltransferase gas1 [Phlyctochytrium planicorne]|nr:1,3-beta-glucanosyltransferase gas1 [Phlyctochytrium planicorne]
MFSFWLTTVPVLLALALQIAADVIIKGNRFFDDASNTTFVVRGISYQPRRQGKIYDPISDVRNDEWRRDLEIMAETGINAIRVYEVSDPGAYRAQAFSAKIDPAQSHESFMSELQNRDMYLILDLGRTLYSINRENPEYSADILSRYLETFNAVANYSNVMAVFAGNEVVTSLATSKAAPHVRALIRDLKRRSKELRRYIPIGYASSDDATIRSPATSYFTCGNPEETVDFFGLNMYEWCGDSSFSLSGYADRTREMKVLHMPLLVSEYGCNSVRPRNFTELGALYGTEMLSVWSGSILYEYSNEDNSYGIVEIDDNGTVHRIQPEFDNFRAQMTSAASRVENITLKIGENSRLSCPASFGPGWSASISDVPSNLDSLECSKMMDTLECVAQIPISRQSVEDLFSIACGLVNAVTSQKNSCADIDWNGRYSRCKVSEKLSWIYNRYYLETCRRRDSCDFNSTAMLRTVATTQPLPKRCDNVQNLPSVGGGDEGTDDVVGSGETLRTFIFTSVFVGLAIAIL